MNPTAPSKVRITRSAHSPRVGSPFTSAGEMPCTDCASSHRRWRAVPNRSFRSTAPRPSRIVKESTSSQRGLSPVVSVSMTRSFLFFDDIQFIRTMRVHSQALHLPLLLSPIWHPSSVPAMDTILINAYHGRDHQLLQGPRGDAGRCPLKWGTDRAVRLAPSRKARPLASSPLPLGQIRWCRGLALATALHAHARLRGHRRTPLG